MNRTMLIIDDDRSVVTSLGYLFRQRGFDVFDAGTALEGVRLARKHLPDVVLLDYKLPDKHGTEALVEIRTANNDTEIIMLTAFGSIPGAVEAVRGGVFDYLTKPVDLDELEHCVMRAAEMQALRKENRRLKELTVYGAQREIIGSSPQIEQLHKMIRLLAKNPNTTVLIQGESGTGKELAARAIHYKSVRAGKPFVDINCAGLSETLLESELFGHEKGAFTDAKNDKMGLLEAAEGGSVFLDEIGELSLSLQPKLLRVLETRTFRKVGGTRDIKADVRFIAATNTNLGDAIVNKRFREDLYFRLSVAPLKVPRLCERGDDIMMLVRHFLSQYTAGASAKVSGISPLCESYLQNYSWPGNIRELKNVIERAVILSPGPLILPEHLPRELTAGGGNGGGEKPVPITLRESEKSHILETMELLDGNQSKAARLLGISRSTLISKLKSYGYM